MATKTKSQPDGSVGAVLIVLAVLISLWQYILALLIIVGLVLAIRYIVIDAKRRGPAPSYEPWPELAVPNGNGYVTTEHREPVKTVPPEYAPRWTKSRRKDAKRELAQWQELFDTHAV